MRAAGILKFVDQHVAIPRFEPEAALRELVHVLEQLDGPFEHSGKVEKRPRIERALVLGQRHRKDSPDTTRHHDVQIAAERSNRLGHDRRNRRRTGAMALPGIVGPAIGCRETGAGESLAARTAVLGEKVRPHAIDERAKRRLRLAGLETRRTVARQQQAEIVGQHGELGVTNRAIGEKRLLPAGSVLRRAQSPAV